VFRTRVEAVDFDATADANKTSISVSQYLASAVEAVELRPGGTLPCNVLFVCMPHPVVSTPLPAFLPPGHLTTERSFGVQFYTTRLGDLVDIAPPP
jgi:hypothetical protein